MSATVIPLPPRPRSAQEFEAGVAYAQEIIAPPVARALEAAHKRRCCQAEDLCHALILIGVTYYAARIGPATVAATLDRISASLKSIAAEDFAPPEPGP